MEIGSSYIPAEVVSEVIGYLTKIDIKNVRLVSKGFSAFGSRSLFESIYISARLKDREAFTAVSKHPVFSQTVREVVYDSTNITIIGGDEEHFTFNKTNYTKCLLGNDEYPHGTGSTKYTMAAIHRGFKSFRQGYKFLLGDHEYPHGTRSTKYTKAAIHRGFKSFIQNYEEQRRLAKYNEVDLTNRRDRPTLPVDFCSLVMDRTRQSEILHYFPDDLVCLVTGLPRMPRVKYLVISDNRYSQNVKHASDHPFSRWSQTRQELSLSIRNKGFRGIDEVIIDPRPWPSLIEGSPPADCHHSWFRGFTVLMQAASMTNMTTLESFNVKRNCGMSGLSHTMFQMSPRELYHTKNTFCNLKDIKLKINTSFLDKMYWPETVAFGGLAQILGAATHLEKLDLRLDLVVSAKDDDAFSFRELIGSHKWPNLHSITLSNMVLKLDGYGFLEFFNRHRRSLRTMRLKQVLIKPTDLFAEQDDTAELSFGNWGKTFVSMASGELNLTHLTLQSGISRHSRLTYFHSCEAEKVHCFLLAGGKYSKELPASLCSHEAHSLAF